MSDVLSMSDIGDQRDNVQSDLRDWLAMHIYMNDESAGSICPLYRSCLYMLFPTYLLWKSDKMHSIIIKFSSLGSTDLKACFSYKGVVHAVMNADRIAR